LGEKYPLLYYLDQDGTAGCARKRPDAGPVEESKSRCPSSRCALAVEIRMGSTARYFFHARNNIQIYQDIIH
jgi:hypothetical protein